MSQPRHLVLRRLGGQVCSAGGLLGWLLPALWAVLGSTACREGVRDISIGADRAPATSPPSSDSAPAASFYISPDGSDSNLGTQAEPWLSFTYALSRLGPGDTLVLLNGVYTRATTGHPRVTCAQGVANGTVGQPITLRAEHERRAFLQGDGSSAPLFVSDCENWSIEGLRVEGADLDAPEVLSDTSLVQDGLHSGSLVVLQGRVQNIVLRRLLARAPNRARHSHVVRVGDGARNVLIEECEAYDFHHSAFEAWRSDSVTFRRNYANGRGTVDAGWTSDDPERGDMGILLEEVSTGLAENNISEGVARGVAVVGRFVSKNPAQASLGGPGAPISVRLLGNMSLGAAEGFLLESRCAMQPDCGPAALVENAQLTDDVAIGGDAGLRAVGVRTLQVSRFSAIGASTGVSLEQGADNMAASPSGFVSSSLASGFTVAGFAALEQTAWGFRNCSAYGPTGVAFSPSAPGVTAPLLTDPMVGECLVYVPTTSPLFAAADDGASVGASIIRRYEGGNLGTTPLWSEGDGAFSCGAVIEGVNDDPDTSCQGVHERLRANAASCPLP